MPNKRKYSWLPVLFGCLNAFSAYAQQPCNIGKPNGDPVRLDNWTNIIIYVIVPIVVMVLYVIWRRRKQQGKDQ
ncbi:MAG: hypothetical protein GC178_00255 [Flavobacteriales bacterium]|nr:hypothetical protein [Flavobacteriales bacterium]